MVQHRPKRRPGQRTVWILTGPVHGPGPCPSAPFVRMMTRLEVVVFRSVSAHPLTLAVLELHAALLESVRRDYERENGRVETAGDLLQLVAFDPAFAWLSPLTRGIDALQEGEDGAVSALARLFAQEGAFRAQLLEKLQSEPDVVLTYARIQRQLLAATPARSVAVQGPMLH